MKKEELAENQFFLVVNGPSCGGKSTVSDILFERYRNIYKAKSDVIKWLISDYDSSTHRGVVHLMTTETIRVALSQGLSVLKEGALGGFQECIEMAKKAGVPLFVVNVEAPWEIIESRFEKRIIEAKKQGSKISNTDSKRLKELYDMYINTKVKTELQFDSSTQSPEEIVNAIVSYIRSKK